MTTVDTIDEGRVGPLTVVVLAVGPMPLIVVVVKVGVGMLETEMLEEEPKNKLIDEGFHVELSDL